MEEWIWVNIGSDNVNELSREIPLKNKIRNKSKRKIVELFTLIQYHLQSYEKELDRITLNKYYSFDYRMNESKK
jgi:hypothetical protein